MHLLERIGSLLVVGGVFAASSASCASSPAAPARACTEMGCAGGVVVDFVFRERGSYVFTVVVDDVVTTCRATLPLARDPAAPCDRDGVVLSLVGSALPAEQQYIGGITLVNDAARQVRLSATRDGHALGEVTFAPAYVVSPGPNGPGCPPPECRRATHAFP